MAVTNLTNTFWKINSTTCTAGYGIFNIESTIYTVDNYSYIEARKDGTQLGIGYYYYGEGEWGEYADTITIDYEDSQPLAPHWFVKFTSGQDVTDSNLITWLESHATQVPDLVNTTWTFYNYTDLLTIIVQSGEEYFYNINFTSNNVNYTSFNGIIDEETTNYVLKYDTTLVLSANDPSDEWVNDAYKTISFTGGDDIANPDFVVLIYNNATQQAPSANIVLGTNTLTGVDTISVTDATDTSIQREFKYGVTPSATVGIKVGNNTLTGVNAIVVKDTSNVDVTFGYEAPTYRITIRGSNTRDQNISVYASDSNSWFSPNEQIGTITATSGSFSYNYNVTKPYIWLYSSGYYDSWHVYALTNLVYERDGYDEENDRSYIVHRITGDNALLSIAPET